LRRQFKKQRNKRRKIIREAKSEKETILMVGRTVTKGAITEMMEGRVLTELRNTQP